MERCGLNSHRGVKYFIRQQALCLLLLAGFATLHDGLQAQTTQLRFKHINSSDGLSNSTIEAIYQDTRGFMWFGTRDGLNKYDGYSITVFKNKPGNTGSLSDNYIRCITEDAQKNLWIGTIDGLNRFNTNTNTFTVYKYSYGKKASLAGNNINSLYTDKQGVLWIGTDNGGLDKYNAADGSFSHFAAAGNFNNVTNCIYEDSKSCLWLGTSKGLQRFDRKTHSFATAVVSVHEQPALKNQPINSIQEDKLGRLWLGIENGGLLVYDPLKSTLLSFKHQQQYAGSLSNDQVKCLLSDSKGRIWAGSINGGLERFDYNTNEFIHHQNKVDDPESLSQRTVSAIYEDRQKNLWVGTHRGGINLYIPNASKFNFIHTASGTNSLSYNDVRAFFEDDQGSIWIGTDGGGLNVYNPLTGTFKHYRNNLQATNSLASDAVLDIMQDREKTLWVSTWGGGLNRFNRKTQTFEHFLNLPASKNSISSNYVQKAYIDSHNNFWVATYYGGLNLFDPATKRFSRITASPDGKTRLKGNNIVSLKEDRYQNLWIGTDDGGLNCYNLVTRQFKHFFDDQERRPDLRVLFSDHTGQLWVGQTGLYVFNRQQSKFVRFTTKGGLSTEFIKSIEEDTKGNLWIATSNGITRLNPSTRSFKKYNLADGLQGLEFEANASLTARNGTMYFGGINGFNQFNPYQIRSNRFVPPVYITGLQIFNKDVLPDTTGNSVLRQDISQTKTLKLNYKQSTLSFQFAALNYNAPENNRYIYKLEGLDDTWYDASQSRKASFTNLSPGKYTFHVKASNNDGVWNPHESVIKVIITPPTWATWWFRTLMAALLFYGTYLILKFKKNADLKKIEENKKEEMHQLKLQFFTNISHDLRTPLSLILGPLENLLRESPNTHFTHYFEMMYRNANRLMVLINELMDFRKVESGALSLKVAKGNTQLFIEEITNDFQDLAQQKAITLTVKLSPQIDEAYFDRQILEKILLNLLTNAIKYTQTGGSVTVELSNELSSFKSAYGNELIIKNAYRGKQYCYIRIADNGIGISRDSLSHLFERYYRITESHLGSGIGLAFVKSLATLHKGDIYVYSERQQGTEIIIGLPCSEHDYTLTEKWLANDQHGGVSLESIAYHQLPQSANAAQNQKQKPDPLTDKPHILIVDDNEEIRLFLRICLEKEYAISEAANGREGIEKSKAEHPDLIISDVMMPGTDGNEFCKMIRQDIETSHIPFVMLTAKTNLQAEIEGFESGTDLYLNKPVSPKLLTTSLHNLFEQRRVLKERYSKSYNTTALELVYNNKDKAFLNQLISTIEAEMSNPDLDIELLCKSAGMSRTKLYNKIKDVTGQSANEFIRSTRLKKAVEILTHEDVLLTEVMYRVGIQTQSYFTKAFKKEFGETPSQFLQNLRKESKNESASLER
ncbi:two-component regulator propeller domain-containing protein [Mucilaginibacter sp. PAMB04168]|uniref:hybrid sensor histidine kinase/response regulator transcription factor n=1 Tax=Mucilaginibacter sp. PAMB04168 TaxID=3138567 RepID=UPI0031F66D5A